MPKETAKNIAQWEESTLTPDEDAPTKTRKARTITPESLSEQIRRQPLESKVKLLAEIKASIEEEKKDIQSKLDLINAQN